MFLPNDTRRAKAYAPTILWISGTGSPSCALEIMLRRAEILVATGRWDQAEAQYARGLEQAGQLGSVPGRARCRFGLGEVERVRGNYPKSLEYLERAAALFRECNDDAGLARAHGTIGGVYAEQGDYPRAQEHMAKRLAYAERCGDLMEIGTATGNIGVIYAEQRDFERALTLYEKQLAIAEQLQDLSGLGFALGNIGNAHLYRGEHDQAVECYRKQMALAAKLGDRRSLCTATGNLGLLYKRQGKLEAAARQLQETMATAQVIGLSRAYNIAAGNLGTVHLMSGDFPGAEKYLNLYRDGAAAVGDMPGTVVAGFNLAKLAELQGDLDGAMVKMRQVEAACREHGLGAYRLVALNTLTGLCHQAGLPDAARALNQEALALAGDDAEQASWAMLYRALLLPQQERAANDVQFMLTQDLSPAVRAEALRQLYRLTGDGDHKCLAQAALMDLYRTGNDVEFRMKAEELERI